MQWQKIETAPRDGVHFYALIDGLPYLSYFDEFGRFIRITHTNHATGKAWVVHVIDGKELLELVNKGEPDNYQQSNLIWQSGFDHKPTHWMPLPPTPAD